MKNPLDQERTRLQIKTLLAEHLGVETEDINDEDFLKDDLHMTPSDMADFSEFLSSRDIDTSNLDFSEVETVEEMLDELTI